METAYVISAKANCPLSEFFSIIVFDEMWHSSNGSHQEPTVFISEI